MSNSSTSKKITGGLVWTFGERITAQLVSTIVTIILARLLDPSHYGVVSIVTVLIAVCNVFVTGGFGSAIVRKKEVTHTDYNTAFILSFTMSLILYAILFVSSPFIAKFYKMDQLVWVIRIMSLRLIIASMNTIQQANVQRMMAFKRFFISTSIGTIVSGFVGVVMAYKGFGVWALVAQYLTNTTMDTCFLCLVSEWFPKFEFSKEKAKQIYSFGWKVLATQLVFTLQGDIRSLIVGKVFGPSKLAYYDQGMKYPSLFVTNINTAINKVMLPAYSREQDHLERLKEMLRKSIRIGAYVMAPILIGFAVVANTFVGGILTDKWLPAVPYIRIFCIMYLTRPLETACHQAMLAVGRSDLALYIIAIVNVCALGSVLTAVFVFHSVFLIAVGALGVQIISLICFMSFSARLLKYHLKEQLADILPAILSSCVMGAVILLINFLNISDILKLLIQVILGGGIYLLISIVFKINAFSYLVKMVKGIVKK